MVAGGTTPSNIGRSSLEPTTHAEPSVSAQRAGTVPNSVIGMTVKANAPLNISAGVAIKTVIGESKDFAFDSQRKATARELTILGSSGSLSLNYLIAHSAKNQVRSMLRRGSNASFDAKVSKTDAQNLIARIRDEKARRVQMCAEDKKIPSRRSFDLSGRPLLVVRRADLAQIESDLLQEFGYGHCAEQAAAVNCYILKNPHDGLVEICTASGTRHTLVVIGRQANSNPNDMSTWGPDVVVCDAWADKIFRLSDFQEMQRPENDVKDFINPAMPHYLTGTLLIDPNEVAMPLA